MTLQAPHTVRHQGLSDFLDQVQKDSDWISRITQDDKTITDPNSTDAQRVAAYNDFAALYKDSSSMSTNAEALAGKLDTEFKAYLQSITLTVANPSASGPAQIPLLSNSGQPITLWDAIQAINDPSQDQQCSTTSYFPDQRRNDLNPQNGTYFSGYGHAYINYGEATINGITYSEDEKQNDDDEGRSTFDTTLTATASLTTWLKYAVAQNSSATAGDLSALSDTINSLIH